MPKVGTKNVLFYILVSLGEKAIVIFEISTLEFA